MLPLLVLSALAMAAQSPAFDRKENWTPRAALDAAARRHLPERGLLFLSGGLVSSARRLSLTLPDGKLSWAEGGKNDPATGKMKKEGRLALKPAQLAHAKRLADNISASKKRFARLPPIADFDVRLILADGDEVKDLDSFGPPMGPVDDLYTYLWSLVLAVPDKGQ